MGSAPVSSCHRCGRMGHQSRDCTIKTCFRCNGRGHMAWECTVGVLCSGCGLKGHLQRTCPNVFCHRCKRRGHIAKFCSDPFVRALEMEKEERQKAVMAARAAHEQQRWAGGGRRGPGGPVARQGDRDLSRSDTRVQAPPSAWDGLGEGIPRGPPVLILRSPGQASDALLQGQRPGKGRSGSLGSSAGVPQGLMLPATKCRRVGDAQGEMRSARGCDREGGGAETRGGQGEVKRGLEASAVLSGLLAYGSDEEEGDEGGERGGWSPSPREGTGGREEGKGGAHEVDKLEVCAPCALAMAASDASQQCPGASVAETMAAPGASERCLGSPLAEALATPDTSGQCPGVPLAEVRAAPDASEQCTDARAPPGEAPTGRGGRYSGAENDAPEQGAEDAASSDRRRHPKNRERGDCALREEHASSLMQGLPLHAREEGA